MLNWLLILLTIIVSQSLILYLRFYDQARGYMLRAALWIWQYLVLAFLIEAGIATLLFNLVSKLIPLSLYHIAILTGVFVVMLPNVIEYLALYRNASEKQLRKAYVKGLLRMNLTINHNFAWAVRSRMEQDVYDCQTEDRWVHGISRKDIRKRIRILYELHKYGMAKKRRDPSLLFRDVGYLPWENFYLLVTYLGRKQLRAALKDPSQSGFLGWDGTEKRRRKGTKADRSYPDPNAVFSRSYDNPVLIKLIREGGVLDKPIIYSTIKNTSLPMSGNSRELVATELTEIRGEEYHHYTALAATWPVGPTILKVLSKKSGQRARMSDLKALFPNDDIPFILSTLQAANLIDAKLAEIKNREQEQRRYRALVMTLRAGPTTLRILNNRTSDANTLELLFPSEGISTIIFNPQTSDPNTFSDFDFILTDSGTVLIEKLITAALELESQNES